MGMMQDIYFSDFAVMYFFLILDTTREGRGGRLKSVGTERAVLVKYRLVGHQACLFVEITCKRKKWDSCCVFIG